MKNEGRCSAPRTKNSCPPVWLLLSYQISQAEIKEFLIAVAPSQVSLFAGGGISLGVEVDVEVRVTFEKETLIDNFDQIIDALS